VRPEKLTGTPVSCLPDFKQRVKRAVAAIRFSCSVFFFASVFDS